MEVIKSFLIYSFFYIQFFMLTRFYIKKNVSRQLNFAFDLPKSIQKIIPIFKSYLFSYLLFNIWFYAIMTFIRNAVYIQWYFNIFCLNKAIGLYFVPNKLQSFMKCPILARVQSKANWGWILGNYDFHFEMTLKLKSGLLLFIFND